MPWTYAFDPLTDTVFVTASGILSDRELVPGVANLMRDPNFHPGVRVFDDYSQVEELRLARPFVSPLHEQTESKRLRSRHALVIRNLPGADQFRADLRGLKSGRLMEFEVRRTALEWLNEGVPAERIISEAHAGSFLQRPAC